LHTGALNYSCYAKTVGELIGHYLEWAERHFANSPSHFVHLKYAVQDEALDELTKQAQEWGDY
jgi:hypothetical protein